MKIEVFKSQYINHIDNKFNLEDNSVLFFSLNKETSFNNYFNVDFLIKELG